MSTSRRTTPRNRPSIEPVIPLQPQSGSCPTTDDRRSGAEAGEEDTDPPTRTVPLADGVGLGPAPALD